MAILLGNQNEWCLVYKFIVYTPTIHDHLSRLTEVFFPLRKANLTIQPDKSEFLHQDVAYLGYLITKGGVKSNRNKLMITITTINLRACKAS